MKKKLLTTLHSEWEYPADWPPEEYFVPHKSIDEDQVSGLRSLVARNANRSYRGRPHNRSYRGRPKHSKRCRDCVVIS